ncbi:type II toxin-antitoxin system RelE family toxin [Anaerovorax odorimutans]|nr:type II toxin-antitoxin system RelE/ParE family toxin [Anaerovorax odorimutans]
MFRVILTDKAIKSLKKLDKSNVRFILAWIRKNLEGCTDPRQHGKSLTGNHQGQWRYKAGTYRIIAEISDGEITILVLNVGHRKEIYKK